MSKVKIDITMAEASHKQFIDELKQKQMQGANIANDVINSEMCCCICLNLLKIHKNIWNESIGKGDSSKIFCFACMAPELDNPFVLDDNHGCCEMFEKISDDIRLGL